MKQNRKSIRNKLKCLRYEWKWAEPPHKCRTVNRWLVSFEGMWLLSFESFNDWHHLLQYWAEFILSVVKASMMQNELAETDCTVFVWGHLVFLQMKEYVIKNHLKDSVVKSPTLRSRLEQNIYYKISACIQMQQQVCCKTLFESWNVVI